MIKTRHLQSLYQTTEIKWQRRKGEDKELPYAISSVSVFSQTNTVSPCRLWQVSVVQHKKRSAKVEFIHKINLFKYGKYSRDVYIKIKDSQNWDPVNSVYYPKDILFVGFIMSAELVIYFLSTHQKCRCSVTDGVTGSGMHVVTYVEYKVCFTQDETKLQLTYEVFDILNLLRLHNTLYHINSLAFN